jgi:hypothetical protein
MRLTRCRIGHPDDMARVVDVERFAVGPAERLQVRDRAILVKEGVAAPEGSVETPAICSQPLIAFADVSPPSVGIRSMSKTVEVPPHILFACSSSTLTWISP